MYSGQSSLRPRQLCPDCTRNTRPSGSADVERKRRDFENSGRGDARSRVRISCSIEKGKTDSFEADDYDLITRRHSPLEGGSICVSLKE